MKTEKISSLTEFHEAFGDTWDSSTFYRGVSNTRYKLLTSYGRVKIEDGEDSEEWEKRYLSLIHI